MAPIKSKSSKKMPRKKKAAPKKKVAVKKKSAQKKRAAVKKHPAKKRSKAKIVRRKKASAPSSNTFPAISIVAGGFKVVCDTDGVLGTYPDRDSANAAKGAHLAKEQNQDHSVVVEGFQG
jgi:hypothetical protein